MRSFAIAAAMIIPILATNAFAAGMPVEKMTVTKSLSDTEPQAADSASCAYGSHAIHCDRNTHSNRDSTENRGGDRGGEHGDHGGRR